MNLIRLTLGILCGIMLGNCLFGQVGIKGEVLDKNTGDPLIGAYVEIDGTLLGATTDYDGRFFFEADVSGPQTLKVTYIGFEDYIVEVSDFSQMLDIRLAESSVIIEGVEVIGSRVSDRVKESPLTVESMDLQAIKQSASNDFYEGLGNMKGVDLTTASLGFTVINTRGFNSTSPVRSLQIIDGVDNQSPGLNFSLGNFLGASELDVLKVEVIQGASTAFYGPNAFNGVISMTTKHPFFHRGLSAAIKYGERNLFKGEIRYADVIKNNEGLDAVAYKINLSRMTADDWVADNFAAVDGTESKEDNPGGYDAVNRYGDEFFRGSDFTQNVRLLPGLGRIHRTGYSEAELVDYDSKNTKASGALHFRLQPDKEFESTELIFTSSFGGGTTIYQGDNRFSLKNIMFFQHRAELKKKDKYFFRTYVTHEDAGDSYDPFFTALKLQQNSKSDIEWAKDYRNWWTFNANSQVMNLPGFPGPDSSNQAFLDFLATQKDFLSPLHDLAREKADDNSLIMPFSERLVPGTPEFEAAFNDIISRNAFSEDGTRFYDKSVLWHTQGEYELDLYTGDHINKIDAKVGASYRKYYPNSQGSILLDTFDRKIDTWEYGLYAGTTIAFNQNRMKVNVTGRFDNHQNFTPNVSPAASLVWTPTKKDFLRLSFSSAIRNPTLTDQYLNYNVGPAILRGNIDGVQDLLTIESFIDFLNTQDTSLLVYFDVAPIQTEKVKTFEIGYRTTLFDALYVDAGYYYSSYTDFIGYQFGIDANINNANMLTSAQVLRVSSNAQDRVTTQGVAIGLNYFYKKFVFRGNYSWNVLNTKSDDPIIPAFNTPEHKFNLGVSGKDIFDNFGFNVNYKWIEGFIFEGSPQFSGFIPSYDLLDGQISYNVKKLKSTVKIGATNILNKKNFQTYGGPRIGRLAYISLSYDGLTK